MYGHIGGSGGTYKVLKSVYNTVLGNLYKFVRKSRTFSVETRMYPLVRLAKPCNHENPKFPRFFLQTGDDLHFGYIKITSAGGIMVHAWEVHFAGATI